MNLGFENEQMEFKSSLSQLDEGIKSLTAMLNSHGEGTVYFGIGDDGNFTGRITIGKKTFDDIKARIVDFCRPRFSVELSEIQNEEGKTAIKVKAYGNDIPYSFKNSYFIRSSTRDEIAEPSVLRQMLLSRDLDLIALQDSPIQDLTFEGFLQIMLSKGLAAKNEKGFYKSHGLLTKQDKFNYMAYLLSDQSMQSIKVVSFAGENRSSMSTRTEFGNGCLLKAVQGVLDYTFARNETKVDLSKGARIETPLFNFEAFREAWINACVHNRWAERIPPTVFFFDDRIEIVSYGNLPFGLNLSSFYKGESMPVNRSLFSIFMLCGYVEQSLRGVPTITSIYGEDAFVFDDLTLTVTIKYNYLPDFVLGRRIRENTASQLTKNQKRVLDFLLANPKATTAQAAKVLGLSTSAVSKSVAKFKEMGLLKRVGSNKTGYWSN